MQSGNKCSKTLLAGDDGFQALYCHDCRPVEIELGSMNLRLKKEAFRNFSRLAGAAMAKLDRASDPDPYAFGLEVHNVH